MSNVFKLARFSLMFQTRTEKTVLAYGFVIGVWEFISSLRWCTYRYILCIEFSNGSDRNSF